MALERSQTSLRGGQAGPGSAGFHSPRALEGISQDFNPPREIYVTAKTQGKALLREQLEVVLPRRCSRPQPMASNANWGLLQSHGRENLGVFSSATAFPFQDRDPECETIAFWGCPLLFYPRNPSQLSLIKSLGLFSLENA